MSIQVDIKKECPPTPTPVVGVDVGIKQAAVVSDGRRLENQRPLASHLGKLGKLQRRLSKKQKTKDPENKRTILDVGALLSEAASTSGSAQTLIEQATRRSGLPRPT